MKIKMKAINILVMLIFIAILASYSSYFVLADTDYQDKYINSNFADNGVIISVDKDYANYDYISNIFKDYGIEEIERLYSSFDVNIFKISFSFHSKVKILDVINEFAVIKEINSIEPNFIGTFDSISNLSLADDQWGLFGEFGININQAWDITTGSKNVRVGVIDTGISFTHDSLQNNVTTGWNFLDNNDNTYDTYGHGTKVAGVIGASSEKISGVNKQVTIVPLKIANGQQWGTDQVIKAIDYAKNLNGTENQIDVLNFSGHVDGSQSLYDAIKSYSGLFVCAAGNNSEDIDILNRYPACYDSDNIITVGAINSKGKMAEFSDYGKISVDLFAPGEDIYTTIPGNGFICNAAGTSLSAPFVTGVAALIYAKYPYLTISEVKATILDNVRKIDGLEDLCVTGGTLDAYKALSNVKHTSHNYTDHYKKYSAQKHKAYCGCGEYVYAYHRIDLSNVKDVNGHRYTNCLYCKALVDLNQTLIPIPPENVSTYYNIDNRLAIISSVEELELYFRESYYYDLFLLYYDEITEIYNDEFFAQFCLIGGSGATEAMVLSLVEQASYGDVNYG